MYRIKTATAFLALITVTRSPRLDISKMSYDKSKVPRKELSVQDRLRLIQQSETQGLSQRKLAEKFNIGKTQVCNILKRKAEYLKVSEEELCAPGAKRMRTMRHGSSTNAFKGDLDELVWKWFQKIRSANIPVSGPMIQQKALEYAKLINLEDFKASKGWLTRFKLRHSLHHLKQCGEKADVNMEVVEEWKKKLPNIHDGYPPKDIFNMDETGLFFRALPDRTLAVKGSDCSGGKKSKERLTVVLCTSMTGEFFTPMVIGKAARPRCFKKLELASLPVTWRHNKKAWMTSDLFTEWATKFNKRMVMEQRHVLLLLDNAPCHPHLKLSNVKLVFLPAHTTSVLQPLDQGIIAAMKSRYRSKTLRAIIRRVDSATQASAAAMAISVFDAIQFISSSIEEISSSTVLKCFLRCGFKVGSEIDDDWDDEDDIALAALIKDTSEHLQLVQPMNADEFIALDDDASPTEELDGEWEKQLVDDFLGQSEMADVSSDSEDENVSEENLDEVPCTKRDCVKYIGKIREHALYMNSTKALTLLMQLEAELDKTPTQNFGSLNDFSRKLISFALNTCIYIDCLFVLTASLDYLQNIFFMKLKIHV